MSNSELIMVHVIIAASTLLVGGISKLMKPEKRNKFVGYRTKWSEKSQATWDFANEYSGNMMLWVATVSVTIEIASALLLEALTSVIVSCAALTIGLTVAIVLTERKLRQKFNEDGSPKTLDADLF